MTLKDNLIEVIRENGIECLPDSQSEHPYYVYPEKLATVLLSRLELDHEEISKFLLDNLTLGVIIEDGNWYALLKFNKDISCLNDLVTALSKQAKDLINLSEGK